MKTHQIHSANLNLNPPPGARTREIAGPDPGTAKFLQRDSALSGRPTHLWLTAILLLLTGLFSARPAAATEVVPLTLTETVRQADTIIVGTVTSQQTRWGTAAKKWMATDYTFAVDDVVYHRTNSAPLGKTVTVTYWGGSLDGKSQGISGMRSPAKGEHLLLMLKTSWREQMNFSPVVGLNQGLFSVVSEQGKQFVRDASSLPLIRRADGTIATSGPDAVVPASTPDLELDTFLNWLRSSIAGIKAAPSELPRQADRNDPRVMKVFALKPEAAGSSFNPASATRTPAGEGQTSDKSSGPKSASPTASSTNQQSSSEKPVNDYYFPRRAHLPIVVNNFPDSFAPFSPEDEYQMSKWNYYANVFQVYATPTGNWAWGNGRFDLCGWPSSADMLAQFGAGWDANTIGICYTTWDGSNYITEGDIALNPAFSYTLDDEWVYNGSYAQAFRQVMTHELGHMWGLDHQFNFLSVMNYMPAEFRCFGFPYMDDAEAIRTAYPEVAAAHTDLGIYLYYGSGYQSVTDASIPTAVTAGESLTVSNYHLENVGTTSVATPAVEWYLTSARNYNAGYYYLGTSTYGTLDRFIYFTPSTTARTFTVPTYVPAGYYYLSALIRNDEGASQATFPFSNNFAFSRQSIQVIAASSRTLVLGGNMAFGNVAVGSSKTSQLTIQNIGNAPLTVTSITYPSSAYSGNFSGTLPAGGSQMVTVTFRPPAIASYTGSLRVNSNKTSGTNTLALSGAGISSATRIVALSGNLAFGNVGVGASKTAMLTITNNGNAPLNVTSITYPFGVYTGNFAGSIPAGGSQNVTVTFKPAGTVTYNGTVRVNGNSTGGVNTIAISGAGATPTRIVGVSGNLGFGSVKVNTSKTATLTIRNTGNAPMTVTSITYPFGVYAGTYAGTIAAGASQNVTVTFTPTSTTTYNGIVRVNCNSTGGTNNTDISGQGIR